MTWWLWFLLYAALVSLFVWALHAAGKGTPDVSQLEGWEQSNGRLRDALVERADGRAPLPHDDERSAP